MTRLSGRNFNYEFPKTNKKVLEKGAKFGVQYVLFDSNETYLICDNEDISWDTIMKNRDSFQSLYVPKFGKYEIEEFVNYFMKEALFISKDITALFNMELLCDDAPYNVTIISNERLRSELLNCFQVVKKERNFTWLKFKWEKIG